MTRNSIYCTSCIKYNGSISGITRWHVVAWMRYFFLHNSCSYIRSCETLSRENVRRIESRRADIEWKAAPPTADLDAKTSLFLRFCRERTLCPMGTWSCRSFSIMTSRKYLIWELEMPATSRNTNHVTDSEQGGVVRLPEYLKKESKSFGSIWSRMSEPPDNVVFVPWRLTRSMPEISSFKYELSFRVIYSLLFRDKIQRLSVGR